MNFVATIITIFGLAIATSTEGTTTSIRPNSPPGRIVGGYEVEPSFKYPWMVSLQYFNDHFCGGTLINQRSVITAAHCTSGDDEDWTAHVHRHDLSKEVYAEGGFSHKISERIDHPQFNKYDNLANDISVWKLSTNATVNAEIKLDSNNYSSNEGTLLKVIGWGLTSSNGAPSDKLLEIKIPVYNQTSCVASSYPKLHLESQFCAGYPEGGKDSCQSDSGGPIFIEEKDAIVLVGVVSWGKGCASKGYPGVYTRTSAAKDFIVSNI